MKHAVMDLLVCPLCKSALHLKSFAGDSNWTQEGVLECDRGDRFPIVEGIPVLIEPHLRQDVLGGEEDRFWSKYPSHRPMGSAAPAVEQVRSPKKSAAEVWGYQWQYFHELWKDEASEEQFYRWIQPLRPEDLKGQLILDAGCGTGRHVWFSAKHARTVIGIDLSFATRVAERLSHDLPNAHIVQADIYRLPFRRAVFDRLFCLGVVHHLPDPKGAYFSYPEYVKKGGSVTIWVYGRENNWFAACALEVARSVVTRRLPLPILKTLSIIPASVLRLVIAFIYAPLNHVAPALSKKLPYNTFFMLFPRLSFRNLWSIVFDQLNAPIAHYYRGALMEEWLKSSGLARTQLSHTNDMSWTLHGIKE